jgi:hypothetical protein
VVDIQSISDNDSDSEDALKLNKTQPTADVDQFFKRAPRVKGSKAGRASCVCCKYVLVYPFQSIILILIRDGIDGCPKKEHTLVDEPTTLRRHMAASHPVC